MYAGGITYSINKSFASLQLIPESQGLRFRYVPVVEGVEHPELPGYLNLRLPLEGVGGIWATARAFVYAVESLDENVILHGGHVEGLDSDVLIKLYRDKPKGKDGRLAGDETCWIRLVTGRSEEERRRVQMSPKDLLCLELACNTVLNLAARAGTHRPKSMKSI